jgi:hypothetical protein
VEEREKLDDGRGRSSFGVRRRGSGMVPARGAEVVVVGCPQTTSFTIAQSKIWGALCQQVHVRSFVLIFEPKGRRLLVASTASFVGALGSLSFSSRSLSTRHGSSGLCALRQARCRCADPDDDDDDNGGRAAGARVHCVCEGGVVVSKKTHKQVGSLLWARVGDRQRAAPY